MAKKEEKKGAKIAPKEFRGVPLEELKNHPRLHEPFLSRFGAEEAEKWFN